MTKYPRTALCLCLGVFLLIVGCDGDGKSSSDTGADTSGTQQKQAQPAPSKNQPESENKEQGEKVDQRKEATSKEGVVDQKAPLDIQGILAPERLLELFDAEINRVDSLPGIPPSSSYNSQRFVFEEFEGFGLAIQVWAFDDQESATARFSELQEQYLNSEESEIMPEGTADAFAAVRGPLQTIVSVYVKPEPRIVALTCDENLCPERDYFENLWELISTQIDTTF